MPDLRLSFLGSPRIDADGSPVELERRKAVALLAYLAVTAQRQSRDALAELLYPGLDRASAYAGFRNILSNVRGAIGGGWIGADRRCAWLESRRGLFVDVHEFRRLAQKARQADDHGDEDAALDGFATAGSLVHGEFLCGLSLPDNLCFEDWQQLEAESLRREHAHVLERMVDIHEARARWEDASVSARVLVALDPVDQEAHARLMRLYARSGKRAVALQQFETCRELLKRNLDEEPGEEIANLRDEIVRGMFSPVPAQPVRKKSTKDAHPSRVPAHTGGPILLLIESGCAGPRAERGCVARELCNADEALCAALTTLRSGRQEGGSPLPRISLHAGDGGPVRARAAALLAAGSPGHILLSGAVQRLLRGPLPEGAALRSLGDHRLSDLGPPLSIYELLHPALRGDALCLRSLESLPNNLPAQPTPFIGRERELAAIVGAMAHDECRLLTLCGPGGTGKTRLALQAAAQLVDVFDNGAFFVDLAALESAPEVVPAISDALDLPQPRRGSRTVLTALVDCLRSRRVLLLLDNFEHVLPAAESVAEILKGCPRVKVMATSRHTLNLREERLVDVPVLGLPGADVTPRALLASEAVRFFMDRAAAVKPGFALTKENAATVADICARLDGLPLSLELAATHLRSLTPSALRERLEQRLSLGGGPRDLPPRQRGLREEISWSYDLLNEDERRVFRRLALFAGGFTIAAAQSVCALDDTTAPAVAPCLESLAAGSLIREQDAEEPRFTMLQTIREFALERLAEGGEADAARRRHAAYFRDLAERAEPGLYGRDQQRWLDHLESENDNLRAALSWLKDNDPQGDGARLAGALGWFWIRKGRFREGRSWLGLFHGKAAGRTDTANEARLAYSLGCLETFCSTEYMPVADAVSCFTKSLRICRDSGNEKGQALCLAWLGFNHANYWPEGKSETEDFPAGVEYATKSIATARCSGDDWILSFCLSMAFLRRARGDLDAGCRTALLEEAVTLARRTDDLFLVCQALLAKGDMHHNSRDFIAAEPIYEEAYETALAIQDTWSILHALRGRASVNYWLHRYEKAKELSREALRIAFPEDAEQFVHVAVGLLCWIAFAQRKPILAFRLWGACIATGFHGAMDAEVASRRHSLDPVVITAAWDYGMRMTREEAIQFVLTAD